MSKLAVPSCELVLPTSLPRVARVYPRDARTGLSLPVAFWLRAMKWAAILMGAMTLVYVVETYFLGLKRSGLRVVSNPSEMAVRFFGLAHYTVATYLLFTSKKMHTRRGFALLGAFSLLAAGFCWLFYMMGGRDNFLAVIAVFFFFLMHALRDEVFFYRLRSGKAISNQEYPHVYRMLIWLQVAGLCALVALLYAAFILKLAGSLKHPEFNTWLNTIFPADWSVPGKALASTVPFLCVAAFAVSRIQRQHTGGLVDLLLSHPPMSVIVLGTVALALSSVVIGTWILNFIILIHFTGWFIFATAGIARQPKQATRAITWRTPNLWIRQNMLGFWVFHGGLALLFFTLIAVNHWYLGQAPLRIAGHRVANPLTVLFSERSLFYWTIVHCTLGFVPKPKEVRH